MLTPRSTTPIPVRYVLWALGLVALYAVLGPIPAGIGVALAFSRLLYDWLTRQPPAKESSDPHRNLRVRHIVLVASILEAILAVPATFLAVFSSLTLDAGASLTAIMTVSITTALAGFLLAAPVGAIACARSGRPRAGLLFVALPLLPLLAALVVMLAGF